MIDAAPVAATVEEQLMLLKGMTIRTGVIHEAQALQLRQWPLLIQNVTKAEARVDVEKRMVTFLCESTGNRPTRKQKLLFKNIKDWVRTILWNETKVLIKINGKAVYSFDNP